MKLIVQTAARSDILSQYEFYVRRGVAEIADRFIGAARSAIDAAFDAPLTGSPRQSTNPRLSGLRTWPIKGFPESRIYYVPSDTAVVIIRLLHDKRDVAAILRHERIDLAPSDPDA